MAPASCCFDIQKHNWLQTIAEERFAIRDRLYASMQRNNATSKHWRIEPWSWIRCIIVYILIANLRFAYDFKNTTDCTRSQKNILLSAIVCDYMKTKLYGDSIQNQLHHRTTIKISGRELDLLDKGSIKLSPQMKCCKSGYVQKLNVFSFAYSWCNVEISWGSLAPKYKILSTIAKKHIARDKYQENCRDGYQALKTLI